MKYCLTFLIAILFLNVAIAQTDTSEAQWKWGLSFQVGKSKTDFSSLNKYQYLLNEPTNFSMRVGATVLGGNRRKFFIGIPISLSVSGVEQGTYNGYTIYASGIYGEAGLSAFYPLYKNYSAKFLRGIYPTAGGRYSTVLLRSKAEGAGVINSDTSFLYENSRAHAYLLNTGVMIELGNFTKQHNKFDLSVVVGGGYNFQLSNPAWIGTPRYRDPGDENPDVNFGGFYFYIGVNYWTRK